MTTQAAPEIPVASRSSTRPWLNRNLWGMTATSFFSDLGHEMATSQLPAFTVALGLPPIALGAIEGIADAASSFIKLGAGWISDRLGHRKGITVFGYAMTGAAQALFAVARGWSVLLAGRVVSWMSRGVRNPLRNAILVDSIPAEDRGKAFGFHRAGDTLGAIAGPLLGLALLGALHRQWPSSPTAPFRVLFLVSAVPGLVAALLFAWTVRERRRTANPALGFRLAVASLPGKLRRGLGAIGIFGLGDFSHTLLILGAVQLLTPELGAVRAAAAAALLYVLHNVTYALAPLPIGAISDRVGRRPVLAAGYLLAAAVSLGLGVLLARANADRALLGVVFAAAGVAVAIVDTLESALVGDLAPESIRGTAYGALGTVNGIGDLASSVIVGALWTWNPLWGFGYAAALMSLGAMAILRTD